MTQFAYDGTMAGLLTAIFEVYDRRDGEAIIEKERTAAPDVFAQPVPVITDALKARRVWTGLSNKLSPAALEAFYHCFLSEEAGIENVLLAFARYAFSSPKKIEENFGHPSVLKVMQTARKVWREKHRMEAFVRFKLLKDGIYFAGIEPDYDVLPIILPHFKSRYADQSWIVYDLRRKRGIYYNKESEAVEEVVMEWSESSEGVDSPFDESEAAYQLLWKDYFKHTGIPARKNIKLHIRHIPLRYWKHLIEKQL